MVRIIDCSKCYHLQETAPDAGYCGHMHINPCYRGLHREPKVTPKVIEELPPLPPKHVMSNSEKGCLAAMERKVRAVNPLGTGEILILRDTPVPPMREDRGKIDWSRYHDFVVKMNRAGCSAREIARKIGVSAESVNKYISSIVDEGVASCLTQPQSRRTNKMARKRIKDNPLSSWQEVDEAVRSIGEIQREIMAAENACNEKIIAAKTKAAEKVEPLKEKAQSLEILIKDYAETHRDEIKGKSRAMTFGTLGFRQSTSLIIKKAADAIEALKGLGLYGCIKIKETVDKERVKALPDETIIAIGAKKKTEDTFWYEPDFEKIGS